ncbi:MAG: hypothetical protein ACTHN0_15755 [Aquihabitans sp.]
MRRYRFLLPLVLPTLIVLWAIAYAVAHNGEPTPARAGRDSTIFELAFYPIVGTAFSCGLGFWSGWLYRRDRGPGSAPNQAPSGFGRPGSSLPPPPPPPPRPPARRPSSF